LLIFDCWAIHKQSKWINECHRAGFNVVFIPAGYTDYLQPMDLSVNKSFKDTIRRQFDEHLLEIMSEQYKKNQVLDTTFTLPQLKTKIVEWCAITFEKLQSDNKSVKTGMIIVVYIF
jgi:hypothetical protein